MIYTPTLALPRRGGGEKRIPASLVGEVGSRSPFLPAEEAPSCFPSPLAGEGQGEGEKRRRSRSRGPKSRSGLVLILLATVFSAAEVSAQAIVRPAAVLKGHEGWVNAVVVSPEYVASGGLDGVVRIHSVKTGAAAFSWTLPKGPDGSPFVIYALSFSPGGRHLAVASSDGKVRIVEPLSGREVVVIDDPSRHPYKAAYFPDGRSLAVGGIDGYIRLYRMEDGNKVGEVKAHADAIQAMAVSANGKTVVTGGPDTLVQVFHRFGDELQHAHRLIGHKDTVTAVAFGPEPGEIVAGDKDGKVKRWNLALGTGGERPFAAQPGKPVGAVAAMKGKVAVSYGLGDIRLYTGSRETRALKGHAQPVGALGFSPDGRVLVSGGRDGNVMVWKVGR